MFSPEFFGDPYVVDLLPDREKTSVVAWLKAHPDVKVISRDRGGAYAEAAREAVPLAAQVADRFHLSQNLGETLERIRGKARILAKNTHKVIKTLCKSIQ